MGLMHQGHSWFGEIVIFQPGNIWGSVAMSKQSLVEL